MKYGLRIMVICLLIALPIVSGSLAYHKGRESTDTQSQIADQYPFLARRIFSDAPKDPLINFGPLRKQLDTYFASNKLTGSLYFEYLPTGVAVHIRGEEKKTAASLLKVPLSMEIYKAIELGTLTPKQQVTLKADDLDSGFGNLYKKGAGYSLTIEEAVKIMLIDSDNTALKVLSYALDKAKLPPNESVFNYLDTSVEQQADLTVQIGARGYSSVLKCLHYACYLNNDDSQRLLQYLTQTSFNNRLVAGITDTSVKIAHKIGVFQQTTQSDCGIIYLKTRPYILCVMIDGQDDKTTNKYISEISNQVYNYTTKQ